jgi:hypothetical protein
MLELLFILCVFSINDRVNPIQIDFQFQEKFIGYSSHLLYT